MMVLALMVGSGDFSSTVNNSCRYLSHSVELGEGKEVVNRSHMYAS